MRITASSISRIVNRSPVRPSVAIEPMPEADDAHVGRWPVRSRRSVMRSPSGPVVHVVGGRFVAPRWIEELEAVQGRSAVFGMGLAIAGQADLDDAEERSVALDDGRRGCDRKGGNDGRRPRASFPGLNETRASALPTPSRPTIRMPAEPGSPRPRWQRPGRRRSRHQPLDRSTTAGGAAVRIREDRPATNPPTRSRGNSTTVSKICGAISATKPVARTPPAESTR